MTRAGSIENLFLNITTSCNMRCARCFGHLEGFRDKQMMDLDTAQKAVHYYFEKRNPESPDPFIMLFGGEPLLNRELTQTFIPWIRQAYQSSRFRLSIFTNGLALEVDLADWLLENDVLFFISLDGQYEIQSKNRNISETEYHHIAGMIRKIAAAAPDSVVPYCVLHKHHIDLTREIIAFIASLGVSGIAVTKNLEENWSEEERNSVLKTLEESKKELGIRIYLYPEIVSDCRTCTPKSMMVYPNGKVFDICYTCSSVLDQRMCPDAQSAETVYFGHLDDYPDLQLDIGKKAGAIRANMQCTITNKNSFLYIPYLAS